MRALGVGCVFVMVSAAAAAQNLLTNGSFQGGVDGWNHPSTVSYDPTLDATGVEGSGSAKSVMPGGASTSAVGQCAAAIGAAPYTIGGRIYIAPGQSGTGQAKIYLNFCDDAACNHGCATVGVTESLTSTVGWQDVELGPIMSPSTTRSLGVTTWVKNTGSSSFAVNFDDVFAFQGTVHRYRWIPAVIHKDVPSKNAKWRSDVAILVRSTSAANLTITMHATAGPLSRTYSMPGSSQILIPDVAGWLGATADSGPLQVDCDQDFFLSGRTYNQVDATHTYGQNYEGQAPGELLGVGGSVWLPQLTESSLYRTNVGIANTGDETANVTLTLYDAGGTQVWQDTRDYAAAGFYQYQQPYLPFGGTPSGYAKVTVNSGSGVVAYASVVDANTGDPTTITMKR